MTGAEAITYFSPKFHGIDYKLVNSIADCIHEAVCLIDRQGKVLVWNKSAEKLYDIPCEEIIGRSVGSFFPNAIMDRVRRTKVAVENQYHSPRQGSHILANAMPLYIDQVFEGVVCTDRDFAEVMSLYAELEQVNSKLVSLENEVKKYAKNFDSIIGNSPAITKKLNMAKQIAPAGTNVMITGESGTGKEVFARAIHEASGRTGLFIPVNCSAIPSELFESEFFGYCPGAFTGANKKGKMGILELANGGTVFLDEIGDMQFFMQAKLLRVLQEREVVRVGGEKAIPVDIRVISATNKDLKDMVKEGKFREDLYYRLNVVEIHLPPLRERREDIPLFIDYFMREFSRKNAKKITKIQKSVLRMLNEYAWPGNIRELMNVMELLVVTSQGGMIQKDAVPDYIVSRLGSGEGVKESSLDLTKAIRDIERENIRRALKISKNNKAQAARLLNIPRGTLYHKLGEYRI